MKVRHFTGSGDCGCGNVTAADGIGFCEAKPHVWIEVFGGHIPICRKCWVQFVFEVRQQLPPEIYAAALQEKPPCQFEFPIDLPPGKWGVISNLGLAFACADEDDDENEHGDNLEDEFEFEEVGDDDDDDDDWTEEDEDCEDEWDDEWDDDDFLDYSNGGGEVVAAIFYDAEIQSTLMLDHFGDDMGQFFQQFKHN